MTAILNLTDSADEGADAMADADVNATTGAQGVACVSGSLTLPGLCVSCARAWREKKRNLLQCGKQRLPGLASHSPVLSS